MLCNWTVIVDPSAISRQSVGDQLGSDRQPIGDRSATSWRLYLERLFLIAETLFGDRSATDWRLVGDQSATKNCVGIAWNRCNWSAISRQPVGNLSATNKNLSTIDLVAERFHLQQPKPPCDQIVPAIFCNRSATSRRPPCNHPAISLRPPQILVPRRSPTGCKVCVTGALLAPDPWSISVKHQIDETMFWRAQVWMYEWRYEWTCMFPGHLGDDSLHSYTVPGWLTHRTPAAAGHSDGWLARGCVWVCMPLPI